MSEVIWVWNPARHGTVKSAPAAGALIDTLNGKAEAVPDSKIEAFIAALTRASPTPAMQPDVESAWDAEDVHGYSRQPSAAFGFRLPSSSNTLALMGATLVHAAAAGVAVFDPQRNWVWLPDGQAHPKDAKDARQTLETLASGPRQAAPSWQQLAKLMHLELDPVLQAARFEDRTSYPLRSGHTHGEFVRPIDGGEQEIQLNLERTRWRGDNPDHDRWGCQILVFVRFESIAEAHLAYWKKDNPGTAAWLGSEFFLHIRGAKVWSGLAYPICVEDAPGRQKVKEVLLHRILPFLDEAQTICDVDRLLNRSAHPMADTLSLSASRLMVAKWCGNPHYDELCRKYVSAVEKHPESKRIREAEVNVINTMEQRWPA